MQLHYFFIDAVLSANSRVQLDEATSRHVVQVLRMQVSQRIHLTNGLGIVATAEILEAHKTKTFVTIISIEEVAPRSHSVSIAISPLKNASRFEWFLEKSAELGVSNIYPIICEHTEKTNVKTQRFRQILISAMLQSRQAWLPKLTEPVKIADVISNTAIAQTKYIAHCEPEDKSILPAGIQSNAIILIGPEGDFSKAEITAAKEAGYIPVSLGNTRLRTETAGIAAAVLLTYNG